jgi:DNA mismatch endonuclease, patch repair protein
MTDVLTPEQRHRNMSNIRSRHTKPELVVRSVVHRLGYRYSLHDSDLPGRPDIVFTCRKKIIFVHGCYWHMHRCKKGQVIPRTHRAFWKRKREGNVVRGRRQIARLRRMGWKVLVVWECQILKDSFKPRLVEFLGD